MRTYTFRYYAQWYARNGTVREVYFERLRDARREAEKHRDGEVFKLEPPRKEKC